MFLTCGPGRSGVVVFLTSFWARMVLWGCVLNVCVGQDVLVWLCFQTKGPGFDPEGLQSGCTLEREAACRRLNTRDQVDEEAQLEEEAPLNDSIHRLCS